MRTFTLDHPDYPERLRELVSPPPEVTISAPLAQGKIVAIVGTREPCAAATLLAREVAKRVVDGGGIVASGAAVGIDTAAHEGALDAQGRTWAIAPSGSDFDVPLGNAPLYARIRASAGSTIVWPFEHHVRDRSTYLRRNGVLAALCDALIVIQAGYKSGARNAAAWARKLKRPVWVALPSSWTTCGIDVGDGVPDFEGCVEELRLGAKLLLDTDELLTSLDLPRVDSYGPLFAPKTAPPTRALCGAEVAVFSAVSTEPQHADEIASRVGLDAPTVTTALLTLALEDVVVEGPGGFFRRGQGS